MAITTTDEWNAARLEAGKQVRAAELEGDKAQASIAFVMLNDVRNVMADGFDFGVRGAATAYCDASGLDKGRVSKCLTVLDAFADRAEAGEGGIRMLVVERGPSLNAIYKAAKALLAAAEQGDEDGEGEGSNDGSDVRTFVTDLAPIVKRWIKRGMTADEILQETTLFLANI